jgi:hypothetical protein
MLQIVHIAVAVVPTTNIEESAMTTWVVITEHPPQLCQTSSKTCAEMYAQLGQTFADPEVMKGLKLVVGPLITSDHRGFLVVEADDYDIVRKFTVTSGAVQWNGVTTIPVIDYLQALEELNTAKPIWP